MSILLALAGSAYHLQPGSQPYSIWPRCLPGRRIPKRRNHATTKAYHVKGTFLFHLDILAKWNAFVPQQNRPLVLLGAAL